MEIVVKESGTFVPGLGLVDIPRRITRDEAAWRINGSAPKRGAKCNFADGKYGGPDKSLKAAIDELAKYIVLTKKSGYTLQPKERLHKVKKLGCSGVIYNCCVVKRKDKPDVITHRFIVSNPNTSKNTTVYIGTENTWQSNWERCLEKAIALRKRYLAEYKLHHEWQHL